MNMPGWELTMRQMLPDDLPVVDMLRQRENWNQTFEDLERFLAYEPAGCFLASWAGIPVGTVTTTAYGRDLGWIGMMLVDPDYRRRGIASELIRRSVKYLRDNNVASIKLDATPAGEPVYRRLGFLPEWEFERWERPGPGSPIIDSTNQDAFDPPAIDGAVFGANRSEWLKLLANGSQVIARGNAFGMLRAGSRAAYLGPVMAEEPADAGEIIQELIGSMAGCVYWDVPGPNSHAVKLARELGFRPIRKLLRMWTGQQNAGDITKQYALADPATG
jgi:GNAT superfamily N-acetyltransferase